MKIVIVGNGKVGLAITEQLASENHDIILMDNDMSHLQYAIDNLDVMCYCGNAASYDAQLEAGIEGADLLVAATSLDEINLLCCLIAKKLKVKHTIARIRNPEYTQMIQVLREELGLSMTINPELATAVEIERHLRYPGAIKMESFARGRVELVEIKIKEYSPLVNVKLADISSVVSAKILICAVQRGSDVYIPSGDFVLHEGDRINFTARPEEINEFFKQIKVTQNKIHDVMIVGGSKIAYYLAKALLKTGTNVKIVEQNKDRCYKLNEMLPKATIVCGDGTDYNLLVEEGLRFTDGFVALTGMDEMNIVISMYAQSSLVDKTITKVNRISYTDILPRTGLETVMSPKEITAHRIVQYVRAMQNSFGSSNVETMHKIVNGKVEALEFRIKKEASYLGVAFKDLRFKENVLVASIVRKGKQIFPDGNEKMHLNDRVIIVTTINNVNDLKDLIE